MLRNLSHRGTHVHGLDVDQFFKPLVENLPDAGQQRLAVVRRPGTPLPYERLACSDDCTINVGLITGREQRQDLSRRWIDGGQRLPRCGRNALAVDDEVVYLARQETVGLFMNSKLAFNLSLLPFPVTLDDPQAKMKTPLPIFR